MAHFGKNFSTFLKNEMKCTVFLFFRARTVNLSFFTFRKRYLMYILNLNGEKVGKYLLYVVI